MGDLQAQVNYTMAGLDTLPNQLSVVPQAPVLAMIVSSEMVGNRDGMLTTRRGWGDFVATNTTYGNPLTFTEFQNYEIAWTDQGYILYTLDGTSIAAFPGQYFAPTPSNPGSKIRFLQENGNLYWLSSVGMWVLDFITNTPILAGAPPALDGTAVLDNTTPDGFLNADASVNYRIVWQRIDANNNLILSAPSSDISVSNSSIGSQTINVAGSATGGSSTGLANNTTVYVASVLINGANNVNLAITGSTAQTYTQLLALLNTALNPNATASLVGGNLVITSTLTQGSAINWADGVTNPLAASLANFVAIEAPIDGARNVSLTFLVPIGITSNYSYIVYRGNQSAAASVPGDDECQQVFSGQPTSGQLSSRIITYLDTVPDDLRGTTIYTAPSQGGIGAANYPPPLAQDFELFRQYVFLANIQSLYSLNESLVAVGFPDGMQVADTVTFTAGTASFTLTGGVAEDVPSGTFLVVSNQDPGTNITLTAQSLTRVANLFAGNTFLNAFYTSSTSTLPGQMNFNGRALPGLPFYINSNRGTAFDPPVPVSGSTQSNTAINDILANQVRLSTYAEPESYPLGLIGGIIPVGAVNFPILRVKANRTYLFIFKGGQEGIFNIAGATGPVAGASSSGFVLDPFDNTVHMVQPVAELVDNSIFFTSDQGIVSCSDSGGVQVISRPIEHDLLQIFSYANFNATVHAAAYPSERQFILNVAKVATDTTAQQSYVYNYLTEQWTQYNRPSTAMFLRPSDDKLYMAAPQPDGSSQIKQERKNENDTDYCDEIYTVNVMSAGAISPLGTQYLILSNAANIKPSQMFTQNGNVATVLQVFTQTGRLLIQGDAMVVGAAIVKQPIFCLNITCPIWGGEATVVKKWSEADLLTLDTTCDTLTLGFQSDFIVLEGGPTIAFDPQFGAASEWGLFPWGTRPWGVSSDNFGKRLHTYVPRPFTYANWLQYIIKSSHTSGPLNLQGVGAVVEAIATNQR